MMEENNSNFDRFEEYERRLREERLDCWIRFTLVVCLGLTSWTHGVNVIWSIFSNLRQQPLYARVYVTSLELYDYMLIPSEIGLLLSFYPKTEKGRPAQWEDWDHKRPQLILLLIFVVGNIMQWFNDGHSLGVDETPLLRDVFTGTVILVRVMIVSIGCLIMHFCFRQKNCPELSPLESKSVTIFGLLMTFLGLIFPLLVMDIIAPHLPKILYF